jgi:nicastrin
LSFAVTEFASYCIHEQVNVSLVEEMVEFFFSTSPGMRCRLVESLMTASQDVASQFVGVFQADPSLSPNSIPEVIGDTTRFVWNFLADRTALQQDLPEKCTVVCKKSDEVCVGATQSQTGQCRASATRYFKIVT